MGWFVYAILGGSSLNAVEKLYEIGGGSMEADLGKGMTYLHAAAMNAAWVDPNAIDWLLEMGVDPMVKDDNGKLAWELAPRNSPIAAKLREASGFEPDGEVEPDAVVRSDGGIVGFASASQIQNMCQENLKPEASSLAHDGVTVDEVCNCVERYAPQKYQGISTHPDFDQIMKRKSPEEQLEIVLQPLAYGCVLILAKAP